MSGLNNYMLHRVVEETTSYVNEKSKDAKGKRVKDELILDAAAGTVYKMVGVIGTLIFIGLEIYVWNNEKEIWVIWGFLPYILLGIWIFGMGQFYKIVITPEKLVHHSSFFGIRRTFPLEKITRVVMTEDGKTIKVYKGKRKVLSMPDDLASGKDDSIPYFEEAGIPVEDRRPKVNDFKVHQPKGIFVISVIFGVVMAVGLVLIIYQMVVVPEKRTSDIMPLFMVLGVEMFFGYQLLYTKFFYLKIKDNDVYYKQVFEKEKHFYFSDITGYQYYKPEIGENKIELYNEKENLGIVQTGDMNADLLVAKMKQMKIPCVKNIGKANRSSIYFEQNVREIENKFLLKKNYLFRE